MKHRIISLSTERPRAVYVVTALLTAVAAAMLLRIDIDTDPENMLPADQADRVFHNHVEETFALHDAIVVGLVNETDPNGIYNADSLSRLHGLSERILTIDGVIAPDLMSLAVADNITQTDAGELRFEWMMREAPATQAQSDRVRDAVARLPLLNDTLVSANGRAAAVYVPIESKDQSYRISGEIESIAAELTQDSDADEVFITGLPVAEDTFGVEMFIQMGVSAPLAALMIFLLMLYFFRSPGLVASPMIVAMVTVIVTMGALIGLGFTVHIMSSMIPIFLMPIAVVDSVHIMSEFADKYRSGDDPKTVMTEVVEHLYRPMLFTSITTAVGFASLLLTPIPPVQVFGAFVAFGVLLAFVTTITLIPAYVVRMRPAGLARLARIKQGAQPDTLLSRALRKLGAIAFRHGKLITGITVGLLAVSVAGMMRIEINDNPVRWFKESHRIRIADHVLNEHFAGTYDAFVVLEADDAAAWESFQTETTGMLEAIEAARDDVSGLRDLLTAQPDSSYFGRLVSAVDDALFDSSPATEPMYESLLTHVENAQSASRYFQTPESLALIEDLQRALIASGLVGKTNALPDVVKVVNRELRTGADDDYTIPATAQGVAQALLQFQSSHRPQDLWHMVTPDYRSTAIWLQLTSGDNQDMSAVIAALDEYLESRPLPAGVELNWAGKTYINVVWQNEMVAGMLKSLLGAFVVVFIIMALLFRSPAFGLLAMLPLTVTIVGVYGLIGWIGKDYDMPTAVLSSLTLGLSVDFAIHFIQRLRDIAARETSLERAGALMFEEPARAIARNAIVIALGFTPLFFAPLVPYVTVGAFMASIMAISGFSTLVLLPAVLSWSGPWLLRARQQTMSGTTPARSEI
ncbi:MAG: efflux RND transporter permease subunit [Gammaproteobacteria bacterium]|nr:efflux RND transporter permease subunit [Gammaproteobacteria bacterium]